jgi:DNA repair exonuclease SbcCD ATPase subunit
MTGWLLEGIEIEGFRGINNEGSPLVIKFKTDKVNSISAPNGVGKSSIFEALAYALSGKIAKLDRLPAAEAGHSYYLNKFHTGNKGSVKLMLAPTSGGNARTVTVTRTASGQREAISSDGADAEVVLAELNREFVLLDSDTFQGFIARSPLDCVFQRS